ncbi:hypothetical protein H632_c599p1 [Helicosporidium sp. ATCC 50920]|nr:hypothetical protein H632_c599p1 [Helicosporidium sp. ATCC 50920]|eukprot:KDD75598.1 hypothetical protein H632_c599p1 [Helicosporidium sp. ATCC 50920]
MRIYNSPICARGHLWCAVLPCVSLTERQLICLGVEEQAARRKQKGKAPVDETLSDEEDSVFDEQEELDSEEDEDEDDESGHSDSDDEEQGAKRQKVKASSENGEAEVVHDLSGDEVDPSNIIASGGRRKTRGGQEPRPKYQAKAAVDSDEDEW